ncbi:MAG: hypothetical protein HYR88_13100 [Verrucomicrobia bacterium]|nr:hypothetical protein [Verrucomicrobiota bacterium]MBI3870587.1 hypothetical protein [Verrucomicrobiota bacterium]
MRLSIHVLLRSTCLLALATVAAVAAKAAEPIDVSVWRTTADLSKRLTAEAPLRMAESEPQGAVIEVDASLRFQKLLGLGSSLEATTCSNLWRMTPRERGRVLDALVDPDRGIGMNLMRICIGSSDFTGDPWYSYDDLPAGETDPGMQRFSIAKDRRYILPVVKEARKKNAKLLFFASPWSPPAWMKSGGVLTGGSLLPQHYAAYALYLARFIEAYRDEGIPLYAITVQNEPGVDRAKAKDPKWRYPSCRWTREQERDFIRDHLGPLLRYRGLATRIWCYDHNYNVEATDEDPGIGHPRLILSDPRAATFVDGVGFHEYQGQPEGMTQFHREFPSTPIHFTEGSVFGVGGAAELVARLRNWASSYNAWVSMLDEQGRPNNGPFPATSAIVRLHSENLRAEYLLEYYAYGHFMKFLQRGAVRVSSEGPVRGLSHVAFRNPDGNVVFVAVNPGKDAVRFSVRTNRRTTPVAMPPESLVTLRWRESKP